MHVHTKEIQYLIKELLSCTENLTFTDSVSTDLVAKSHKRKKELLKQLQSLFWQFAENYSAVEYKAREPGRVGMHIVLQGTPH